MNTGASDLDTQRQNSWKRQVSWNAQSEDSNVVKLKRTSLSNPDCPSVHHEPKAKGWKIMKGLVETGTMLLHEDPGRKYSLSSRSNPDLELEHCGSDDEEDISFSNLSKRKRSPMSIRQSIVDRIQDGTTFSIQACLLAIALYLAISVTMYTFVLEPQWTIIDSCYFAVTTFTTLGYGDLSPTNTASVIFTCGYAFCGVAFMGVALGVLGNRVIESHHIRVEKQEEATRSHVMTLFGTPQPSRLGCSDHTSVMQGGEDWSGASSSSYSHSTSSESHWMMQKWNRRRFFGAILVVLVLVCGIAWRAHWGILTTIYYVIITSCTIGYGDLVPTTQSDRLLAVIYIPLACLIMGQWLGYVANWIMEKQSSDFRKKQLTQRELTEDDLLAMDLRGDGKVSWAEFLEFMLLAMDKIDYELLDDLQAYFQKLDATGTGELSRDDLVAKARQKLKGARRKLELSSYKQELLQTCQKQRESADGNSNALERTKDFFHMTARRLSAVLQPNSVDSLYHDENEQLPLTASTLPSYNE